MRQDAALCRDFEPRGDAVDQSQQIGEHPQMLSEAGLRPIICIAAAIHQPIDDRGGDAGATLSVGWFGLQPHRHRAR